MPAVAKARTRQCSVVFRLRPVIVTALQVISIWEVAGDIHPGSARVLALEDLAIGPRKQVNHFRTIGRRCDPERALPADLRHASLISNGRAVDRGAERNPGSAAIV